MMIPTIHLPELLTLNDLKSGFRDFKIRNISDNIIYKIDKNKFDIFIKSEGYKVLLGNEILSSDIITGSTALYLFGLIDRNPNDIDLISEFKDKYDYKPEKVGSTTHIKIFPTNKKNIKLYSISRYNDKSVSPNYIGKLFVSYKKLFWMSGEVKFDLFEFDDNSYIEYRGLKVELPFRIISEKMNVAAQGDKHFRDLKHILRIKTPKLI